MSSLNITEYENLGRDKSGYTVSVGEEESLVRQNVTYTTTSVQSSSFNARTRFIRVIADADTRVAVGLNPTAVAGVNTLIPAGSVEYFGVKLGKNFKIAAVQS